jgi:predicted RNase H-like HicB family nuclease
MKSSFKLVFEPVLKSEGGGYFAYAEEVPGAISEGDTLEQAFEKSM